MNGWKGRVLVVDLSKREIGVQSLAPEIYEKFIGATGINAWLLWQEVPPEVSFYTRTTRRNKESE